MQVIFITQKGAPEPWKTQARDAAWVGKNATAKSQGNCSCN